MDGAVLPPPATARYLNGGSASGGWAAAHSGQRGIPALQRRLATVASGVDRMFHVPPGTIRLNIRRLDIVHQEVQQGIEPQAVALAMLGGLASLALLVLAGQALAQLLDRSAPDLAGLRALGASGTGGARGRPGGGGSGPRRHGTGGGRRGRGLTARPGGRGPGVRSVRGMQADPLVLTGGGCVLAPPCSPSSGCWPGARRAPPATPGRPGVVGRRGRRRGRPAGERGGGDPGGARAGGGTTAGSRAGHPGRFRGGGHGRHDGGSVRRQPDGTGRQPGPVRLELDTADGQPGWVRELASAAQMDRLVSGQPGVTGWSTFAFTQIPIDGQSLPVLGLTRHVGSVEPPTTSGHPIAGPGQIELGVATLRQLGQRIGDTGPSAAGGQAHAHHRGHRDAAVDRADAGRPCVAGPRRHARRQHAAGRPRPSPGPR